jgi:hypothetical protein
MKSLKLRDLYTREDIHSIFSPSTIFTPQAGTWGLHGIIKIPDRDNDFVFIVTYGQSQGDHEFDEGITRDGVLSWQSQPRQDLNNNVIQQLINHKDLTDNIYLFLRETKKADYQYLGRLAYLEHDVSREKPVYFQWQLLDWDESDKSDIAELAQAVIPTTPKLEPKKILSHTDELPIKKRQGTDRESFRARKSPDYATKDAKNRQLGLDGELLVLEYERARLIGLGLTDLSEKIIHTSVIEGDGAGYDIQSFNEEGSPRYIEVKATRGSLNTDFYMSPNEIKFAKQHSANFVLYRVFDMHKKNGDPKFYSIKGDIMKHYEATPVNYRMSYKSDA